MEIVLMTSEKQVLSPMIFEEQYDQDILTEQVQQLGLKIDKSKDEIEDKKELFYILNRLLSYPSTVLAETHRSANRLGMFDVNSEERYKRITDINFGNEEKLTQICKCCGFIVQEKDLSVCKHSIEEISSLGISTYLYFKTIFNVSILLAIMLIVYSTYSFATNIKASNIEINGNYSSTLLNFLSISLGSKQLFASEEKKMMYVIGAWIGCGMLIIWSIAFLGLKYNQKEKEVAILLESKSVSQFSLVIENIPTGLTQEQLQRQLKEYLKKIKQTEKVSIQKLQVVKYNQGQPFYFNQKEFDDQLLKKELDMTKQYKDLFISWIQQRKESAQFSKSKKFRLRKYKQYNRVLQRKSKIISDLNSTIKQKCKQKNNGSLTTAFVSFASNHQKNFLLDHNPENLLAKIKDFLPCFKNKNRFFIKKNDVIYDLRIFPAPDPQDIVWNNIGVSLTERIARKFLTYSITGTILAVSFVITYSLSTAKVDNKKNQLLSTIISLSIAIINLIIGQVIEVLTSYERDYTMTNYQISLAIKTVLAQLINSIFIPITAGYFIKQNIYEEGGLIEDIFILGIANSFVYPIAKIVNPSYFLRYLLAKYKLIPSNKLGLHQFQVNEMHEKLQFQVGYEYIYIVNLFIFTSFFVSLQPILPIFALLGLLFIYWIQKYTLFHRCQRPVPGTPIINTTVSQMIYFGAVAYTLGSMTWANFLPQSKFQDALVPNIIALGLATLIFLVPYETIFRVIFKKKRMPEILYSDTRIFFTSEYDRLNPATSEIGVKEYFNFLQNKIRELQTQNEIYKSRLSYQLQLANRPNFYKQPSDRWITATKYECRNVVQNLVRKQSQNMLTPQLIASIINKEIRTKANPIMKSRVQQSLAKLNPNRQLFRRQTEQKELKINDIDMKERQEQSKNYLQQLQKIESIDMLNMGKTSNFTYNKNNDGEQSSVNNEYFKQIQNVRSFILKTDSMMPGKEVTHRLPENKAQFSFNKQKIQQESAAKEPAEYKNISFRGYMRGTEIVREEECLGEVQNRFSINSQNILPLCLESQKGRESLYESQIRFYNLASFQ